MISLVREGIAKCGLLVVKHWGLLEIEASSILTRVGSMGGLDECCGVRRASLSCRNGSGGGGHCSVLTPPHYYSCRWMKEFVDGPISGPTASSPLPLSPADRTLKPAARVGAVWGLIHVCDGEVVCPARPMGFPARSPAPAPETEWRRERGRERELQHFPLSTSLCVCVCVCVRTAITCKCMHSNHSKLGIRSELLSKYPPSRWYLDGGGNASWGGGEVDDWGLLTGDNPQGLLPEGGGLLFDILDSLCCCCCWRRKGSRCATGDASA